MTTQPSLATLNQIHRTFDTRTNRFEKVGRYTMGARHAACAMSAAQRAPSSIRIVYGLGSSSASVHTTNVWTEGSIGPSIQSVDEREPFDGAVQTEMVWTGNSLGSDAAPDRGSWREYAVDCEMTNILITCNDVQGCFPTISPPDRRGLGVP